MFLEHYLGDLYCRADLIVQAAREEVNLRRQAVAPDVEFSEYSKGGQPLIDLVHSEIEAVRPILQASLDAYREMGIPQRELWRFFEAETKFIFRKFPLIPDRLQEVLKSEFSFTCLGPIDWKVMREGNDAGFSSATALPVLEGEAADNDGNSTPLPSTDPIAADRTAALEAYKREGWSYRIKITDEMVARKAKKTWHTRDPVKWWKANDLRCTPEMDRLIWAVLKSKPHIPTS
jgi:hypothetical protein